MKNPGPEYNTRMNRLILSTLRHTLASPLALPVSALDLQRKVTFEIETPVVYEMKYKKAENAKRKRARRKHGK